MSKERDPYGRDPHAPGSKVDLGKLQPELIHRGFARALHQVTEIGTYGAEKYTPDGWEQVPEGQRRYMNAMYRHLGAHHQGEATDPETGYLHLAHAAWNLLALLELRARER